jgi:hypothetical protein
VKRTDLILKYVEIRNERHADARIRAATWSPSPPPMVPRS